LKHQPCDAGEESKDKQRNPLSLQVDRIIFCVFLGGDLDVYQQLLPKYFPSSDKFESGQQQEGDKQEKEHESAKDKKEEHHKEGESEGMFSVTLTSLSVRHTLGTRVPLPPPPPVFSCRLRVGNAFGTQTWFNLDCGIVG